MITLVFSLPPNNYN
ncbi:hypothetical protein RDI58_023882 [Solanum bulbocastanum]|uniref:Uncharacterized protein n=1 Tax=Solanum bulbocastanum TaxID=147425 RepID=A0AAN8SZ12_SOLBU